MTEHLMLLSSSSTLFNTRTASKIWALSRKYVIFQTHDGDDVSLNQTCAADLRQLKNHFHENKYLVFLRIPSIIKICQFDIASAADSQLWDGSISSFLRKCCNKNSVT